VTGYLGLLKRKEHIEVLFKDLKQLGRGRRNSNETVSDTDADVITSAKTDAGADASADSQQADADDPLAN